MRDIKYWSQLDDLILAEVNVKVLSRYLCMTEKGNLYLNWDGVSYKFDLGGKDVTTPRLLEETPAIIEGFYEK